MNLNLARYAWDTGALVSILGLLTVFSVLVIIMLVLMIMERIFAKKPEAPKKEVKETKPEAKDVQAPRKKPEVTAKKPVAQNDAELVAVISAAIAASMGVPARSLKIKSFKRVGKAWNDASRQENIYNSL